MTDISTSTSADERILLPPDAFSIPHRDPRPAFPSAMRLVPGAVAIVATAYKDKRGGLAEVAKVRTRPDGQPLLYCDGAYADAVPHDGAGV